MNQKKVLKNILYYWTKLTNSGITSSHTGDTVVRIQMLNRVSLLSGLFAYTYVIYLLYFEFYSTALIMFSTASAYLGVLHLNHLKLYAYAKVFQILLSNFGIFYFSYILGYASGVHLFVLLAPIFNLSLFHIYDLYWLILSIGSYLLNYFLILYFQGSFPASYLNDNELAIFYATNICFIFILISILLYFIKAKNVKYINELLEKQNTLSVQQLQLEDEIVKRKKSEENIKHLFDDLSESYNTLEQFSFIVSHNLRAPVANLIGLSEVFDKKNPLIESNVEIVDHIGTAALQLDQIIKDLNSILSVNKNNLNEKNELVFFEEEIIKIESMLSVQIEALNAKIIYDFGNADQLYSIKSFIYSIFYNLISNSLKYSRHGVAPIILIKGEKSKNYIRIIFSDNGVGIDLKKNKDKIFKLYSRFHRNIEGRGLGLYLVKTQVQLVKGKIDIESIVNEGTTFTLQFRIDDAKQDDYVG